MMKMIFAVVALALTLSGQVRVAIADEAAGRAVLVLDASGSMWGQVENTSKIIVARDVIQKLMSNWDPKVHLGVTAYGHREKGNCADIENLVPVGVVDTDAVMTVVNGLQPKGKTPLGDAIRQAAKSLKYTEERATVILVSDGKETCQADPCAVAAELEAGGIDLTVHVIGFDLADEEKAQLQCIADNTGGKFLSADNAPQLHDAMKTTVQLVAKPEPPKKRVIKLKQALTGLLSVKGVITNNVYLYEPGKTVNDRIASFRPGRKSPEQLRPGTYVLGTTKQELSPVDIAPGQEVTVDMKDITGSISVKGVITNNVYLYERGKTLNERITGFRPGRKSPEQLRPGTYVLGTAKQELTPVEIASGQEVTVDLKDITGSISVKGVITNNVYLYEPGKTVNDRIASFRPGRKSPEQLRPGIYVLGTAKQELATIEIASGEELVVDLGN